MNDDLTTEPTETRAQVYARRLQLLLDTRKERKAAELGNDWIARFYPRPDDDEGSDGSTG